MKTLAWLIMTIILVLPLIASAQPQGRYQSKPTATEMVMDFTIARPVYFVTTTLGSFAFVLSAPFSMMGGNMGDSFAKMVAGPARNTFIRCLGCSPNNSRGYDPDAEENTEIER